MVCITLFAIMCSVPIVTYRHEHNTIRMLSDNHHFDEYQRPGRWWGTPPAVIGFVEWTGPEFLEQPMRRLGAPWFDRVIRVDIQDDSQIDFDRLADLTRFRNIECIAVHNATHEISKYEALQTQRTDQIEWIFDSSGPYHFFY